MLVNREQERLMIEEALNDLKGRERLVQTPLLNFYGIPGIGKSSILLEALLLCQQQQTRCVAAIAEPDQTYFFQQYDKTVQDTQNILTIKATLQDALAEAENVIGETEKAKSRVPLAIIIDNIDNKQEEQMDVLKLFLQENIVYTHIFIVLASRRRIVFEDQKKVMRKLTGHQIPSLTPEDAQQFLNAQPGSYSEEQQAFIYKWTRGHPLAMLEMAQAFREGFDLDHQQDYEKLMHRVVDRVITQGLLAGVEAGELNRFQALLRLLAFPRRFNLLIMRQLVEQFEPDYTPPNSLAYIPIPEEIEEATGVLNWSVVKAGFSIEEPIRTILLLQYRIGNNALFQEIHLFLAKLNWEYALEVEDDDRIRYLLEFLYHHSACIDSAPGEKTLQEAVTQIIADARLSSEQLRDFRKEFLKDSSLLEELGPYRTTAQNILHAYLADRFYAAGMESEDIERRINILYDSFVYRALLPERDSMRQRSIELFQQLLEDEHPRWVSSLFNNLSEDKDFLAMMGEEYNTLENMLLDVMREEE